MNDRESLSDDERDRENGLTRRQFMKTAGLAVGTALTEGALITSALKPALSEDEGIVAPTIRKGTKLHFLGDASSIPPADDEFKRQADEWSKQTRIQVIFESLSSVRNNLQKRIEVVLSSGTGPDILVMAHNWPHLYADGCVNVDDVAEKVEKTYGGYYRQIRDSCVVQDHYKAVPLSVESFAMTYREDWFKEAGIEKFPETWEEFRKFGKALKDQGQPFGQTFSYTSYVDASAFVYPYLWSFGGKEVEEDGKTIALDSKETLQAVEFMVALWKEAFDETGLSWDNIANNRAFLTQQISCTLNTVSIYFVAKQHNLDLAQRINHALIPTGPIGRFHYNVPYELAITKYSQNIEAAKEFILFMMDKPNYYKRFEILVGHMIAPGPDHETHPI
jgi:multiple sugar transport system substrate-binding protein